MDGIKEQRSQIITNTHNQVTNDHHSLTNEVEGIVEVGQKFLTEVVVYRNPHEVGVLHEVRLGAGHTNVQLIQDIVALRRRGWA